jgi:hypothetical protein
METVNFVIIIYLEICNDWSLLPSCCNYPCDTSSNFRVLLNVLCDALQNQPDLRGIVYSSITNTMHYSGHL